MVKKWDPVPCMDRERRTCIAVDRDDVVKYIPLDIENGLRVELMTIEDFDDRYRPMLEYPIEKAAKLYSSYARSIGATPEAMSFLSSVVELSQKEIDMAVAKKKDTTKAVEEKKAATKAASKKTTPPKKEPKAKSTKPSAEKTTKEKAPRDSAAQMFQDLIIQGKLTDDQIFAKVQEKFGLDDKKKGYVKWYRSHLKKLGKNPPDAK